MGNLWPAHLNAYLQSPEDQWIKFLSLRKEKELRFPRVSCAYETLETDLVITKFVVVPSQMARTYCHNEEMHSMQLDHHGLVKATSANKEPYSWVKRRIVDATRDADLLDDANSALKAAREEGRKGKNFEAHRNLAKGRELFDDAKEDEGYGYAQIVSAELDEQIGLEDKAREKYQDAKNFFSRRNNYHGEAEARLGLGLLETKALNYLKAIDQLTRAFNFFTLDHDVIGKANSLLALGQLSFRQNEIPVAAERFREAMNLFQSVGDPYGIAHSLLWIGNVQSHRGGAIEMKKQ